MTPPHRRRALLSGALLLAVLALPLLLVGQRGSPGTTPVEWSSARPGAVDALVADSRPESVDLGVTVGCPRAAGALPAEIFRTSDDGRLGLTVVDSPGRLVFRLGPDEATGMLEIASLERASLLVECPVTMTAARGEWRLTDAQGELLATAGLPALPLSTLSGDAGPSGMDVTARVVPASVAATGWSGWQWAAVVLLALALVCLAAASWTGRARLAGHVASWVPRPDGVSALLGAFTLLLLVWAAVGPALLDDGWYLTSSQTWGSLGGFSSYYEHHGARWPVGTSYLWISGVLSAVTVDLVVLRLPAVIATVATTVISVRLARRVLPDVHRVLTTAVVALVMLGWSVAYLVTLRPEPYVALLLVAVALATARFLEAPSGPLVAVAVLLTAVAVSVHTTGVAALAVLALALPRAAGWVRRAPGIRLLWIASAAAASAALFVILATVNTSVDSWRADRETFSETHYLGWADELGRYSSEQFGLLGEPGLYGVGPRSLLVLMAIAAAAWVLVDPGFLRSAAGRPALTPRMSAAAFGLALALFATIPSKWTWHFGALAGLGALVTTVWVLGLWRLARRSSWPLVGALAVATVVSTLAWRQSEGWRWDVLQDQYPVGAALEGTITFMSSLPRAALAMAGLALVVLLAASRPFGRRAASERVWRRGGVYLLTLAPLLVMLVVSYGSYIGPLFGSSRDLYRGSQALGLGPGRCGLGEAIEVTDPRRARPGRVTAIRSAAADAAARAWGGGGLSGTTGAWVVLPAPDSGWAPERIHLPSEGSAGEAVQVLSADGTSQILDVRPPAGISPGTFDLRIVDLPAPPAAAQSAIAVRRLVGRTPRGAVVTTRDIAFAPWVTLDAAVGEGTALVNPFWRLAIPCPEQPGLGGGLAQKPDVLVANWQATSSPWRWLERSDYTPAMVRGLERPSAYDLVLVRTSGVSPGG